MTFSHTINEALGHYVYRLLDPRDGSTFYIGKGQGNRVFEHLDEIKSETRPESKKVQLLNELVSQNLNPKFIIHRHGMDESTAFEVEAALIDAYDNLVNDQAGHYKDRGVKTVQEIKAQYELSPMPIPNFPVLVINVNNIHDRLNRDSIYNQVKGHWVLSLKNAQKVKYVIAAYRSVAIGIFEPKEWYKSEKPRRYCFDGQAAEPVIWEKYIGDYGKRIDHKALKNGQNPIKYFFP